MSRVLSLQSRLDEVNSKPLRTKVDRAKMRGDPEVCVRACVCVYQRVCAYKYIHASLRLYTSIHVPSLLCINICK